jgi:hypothetical protein
MKLVCIDNKHTIDRDDFTIGKIYEFYKVTTYSDIIELETISDKGNIWHFDPDKPIIGFISVEEWREKQLDKLI